MGESRTELIGKLQESQKRLSEMLATVASDQDWQSDPEEWSFRFLAAHLATGEKECLQPRLQQIAAGEQPSFDLYLNSGRDFSQMDLMQSLQDWQATRQEICDFVRDLPEEKLSLTGSHSYYGTLTILSYLRAFYEHDQDHLHDLEQMMAIYRQQKANR